ncbi:MAG: hypothetical protein ABI443_12095 [Chthoniobacterales bacterium]
MDLSKFNTITLNSLIRLTKRKDALHKQVQKIEAQLAGLFGGKSAAVKAPAKRGRKPGKKAKAVKTVKAKKVAKPAKVSSAKGGPRKRRSALKDQVFTALKQAGKTGTSVKDIADKIKIKPQNLHVWFSTTGKKFPQIVKVEQGRYRLR